MNNRKANLFVVGAMKAGTTSFNDLLKQHNSIYFSPIKEPNFFVKSLPKKIYKPSRFFSLDSYFKNQFPEHLHIADIEKREHYDLLFSNSKKTHLYKAEGSTAYFHAPETAKLIYEYNQKAKIIIILRDPLKRAFSHYKMDLGLGKTKKTFEEEIKLNLKDLKENNLSNWSYIGMSLYNQNIKRFNELFGDQVLLLNFENLLNNKEATLRKVFHFLNIEKMDLEIPHNNPTANLRFQKLLYFFKQLGLKDLFSFVFPKSVRNLIFNKLSKKEQLKLELTKITMEELEQVFDNDIKSNNS